MNVFNAKFLSACSDLFIDEGAVNKQTTASDAAVEIEEEEKDPFDEMMEES